MIFLQPPPNPWINPGDISVTVTPEHILYALIGGFVTIGIPLLRFMWKMTSFVSDMKMKMDMMWNWFCTEHGIDKETGKQ